MQRYSISMVVPAYNEEELIGDFITQSISDLEQVSDDYEIVLVNDGSTDKTSAIAEKLAGTHPCLKIINLPQNSGVGVATKIGLRAATKEVVFNNTVDAFFDTKELPQFLPYLEDYDVISGYRTNLKSNNIYGKILTLGNYYLIKFLFLPKLRAYQTVQFFKKPFLDKIDIEASTTFIAPELLIKAYNLGCRIKEIGTEYKKRKKGKGKCGKPINVFKSFRDIIKFWFKWRIMRRDRQST